MIHFLDNRIWKRNQEQANAAAAHGGRRFHYVEENQRAGQVVARQQTNGDMEMEMSPMLLQVGQDWENNGWLNRGSENKQNIYVLKMNISSKLGVNMAINVYLAVRIKGL